MQDAIESWLELGEIYTGPMQRMSRVSSEAAARMGQLHNHVLEDCLDANLEQLRVFGECRDPSEFLRRESEWVTGNLERMRNRSEEAMAVFAEVREEFDQLFRDGVGESAKVENKAASKPSRNGDGEQVTEAKKGK